MKRLLFALVVAVFMTASGAWAGSDIKIGHVNLEKALNDCAAGHKAKEELKVELEKREKDLKAKEDELKKLRDELEKKGPVWNQETRESKEKEFQAKAQEFQTQYYQYNDEMNKKKIERESAIVRDLKNIVKDYAKKNGYTFIIESSDERILYSPEGSDITDEVIKAHNAKSK